MPGGRGLFRRPLRGRRNQRLRARRQFRWYVPPLKCRGLRGAGGSVRGSPHRRIPGSRLAARTPRGGCSARALPALHRRRFPLSAACAVAPLSGRAVWLRCALAARPGLRRGCGLPVLFGVRGFRSCARRAAPLGSGSLSRAPLRFSARPISWLPVRLAGRRSPSRWGSGGRRGYGVLRRCGGAGALFGFAALPPRACSRLRRPVNRVPQPHKTNRHRLLHRALRNREREACPV